MPFSFAYDGLLALAALIGAFFYLRVWWSYIIAGEMVAMLGLSMIFHYFYINTNIMGVASWYLVYSIFESLALIALLFCLTNRWLVLIYLASAAISLAMGVAVSNDSADNVVSYPYVVGILDACKVAFMVAYWRIVANCRHCDGYNRLHVWEN